MALSVFLGLHIPGLCPLTRLCPRSPGDRSTSHHSAGGRRGQGGLGRCGAMTLSQQRPPPPEDPAEMPLTEAGGLVSVAVHGPHTGYGCPGEGSHNLGPRRLAERGSGAGFRPPAKGGPRWPPQRPLCLVRLLFPRAKQRASVLLGKPLPCSSLSGQIRLPGLCADDRYIFLKPELVANVYRSGDLT